MNDKLKKYKFIKFVVNGIYFVFLILIGAVLAPNLPTKLYELEPLNFMISFGGILILCALIFYIFYFISIIFHELGHLLFGLKAKLVFVSFNILFYTFCIEKNKLKLKKEAKLPGILGYCNMTTEKDKEYDEKLIKLYYSGGIIFNIILALVSTILLILVDNIYLKLICILNLGNNLYLAINNAIPAITKSGNSTDALQILYYKEDKEYINTMSKLQKLQSLLAKGIDLKEIDSKLFNKTEKFKTNSDVLNAMIYVDYLSSKEEYQEGKEYAEKILKEAKSLLSKQYTITLKLQLINCIFYSNGDLEQIKEIWDEDIKKFLELMGKAAPSFIVMNYMYATLIEKNEENSQKYLKQFEQLNKKNYDNYLIKEAEDYMNAVNKRMK